MTARSGRGRRVRLMRVGIVLVVLLQTILAPIASALTTDVTLLSQDFASYSGVDANAPAGWTFTSIGHYTSASSSGIAPNSLQLNSSNSVARVTYALASNQTSETLSFWIKGNSTGTSGSTITITESSNGTDWTPVASYTRAAIPTTGATMIVNLLPATTSVQFAYTKVVGNVALDDVVISGHEVDDAPTKPTAYPAAGVYNSPQTVTLSSSDDSELAVTIRYTVDGSTPDQTSQLYTNAISVGADTTIKAIAYDATGNASGIATFSYVIDTVVPTIQNVQYSNNNLPTNSNVTVTIAVSEPVESPDGWTKVDDTTFTKEYSANTADSVSVRDIAGNVSEASTIDVKGIDKSTPTIAIDGNGENGIYSSAINYAASDDVAVKSVTINGIEAPWNGSIASSGTHTITVVDTANNTETITITIAIPIVLPVLSTQTPSTLQLLSPRSLVSSSNVQTLGVDPSTTSETPQRADVSQANIPDVINTAPGKDIALAPSEEGWKLWGIAWYWYATTAGLAGAGWWLFGRKYFIPSKDEF